MNSGFVYRDKIRSGKQQSCGHTLLSFYESLYENNALDWKAKIENGEIFVNGSIIKEPGHLLQNNDTLEYHRPPWIEPDVPTLSQQNLLRQDSSGLFFFHKPSAIPTLPNGNFLEHSFLNMVRKHFNLPNATPLHRLGRGTSGVLVFAGNEHSAKDFTKLFESRQVEKEYKLVVKGVPEWDVKRVECDIGIVDYEGCKGGLFAATKTGKGKKSLTTFRVLKRGQGWSLLTAAIETGRPHQIRIMSAYCGFPLINDPLYGVGGGPLNEKIYDAGISAWRLPVPGDSGYLLHSWRIKIAEIEIFSEIENFPECAEEWRLYLDDTSSNNNNNQNNNNNNNK